MSKRISTKLSPWSNSRKNWMNLLRFFFVAEKAKEIIGYTKVNLVPAQTDVHDPESLEIARLYVLEEHLGSGLGKWLLDTAIDFAKQNQKKIPLARRVGA